MFLQTETVVRARFQNYDTFWCTTINMAHTYNEAYYWLMSAILEPNYLLR